MSDPRTITGFVCGDRYRSAEDLHARVPRAASVLAAQGVGASDVVAILMRNDLAFVEVSYACTLLGAIAVPINWHFRKAETRYVVEDAAAKVVVAHADLLDVVPDDVPVLAVDTPPEVRQAYGIRAVAAPEACSWERALTAAAAWEAGPSDVFASMIYTSGTTGAPKGVRRLAPIDPRHPGVAASFGALGLAPGMRTVVCGPMYHSAPNTYALLAGRTGGLVVLQPRFDAEQLLVLIERHAITSLHLVPTMMVRLLALPEDVRARYDISSLRVVAHAAAPCPPDVKRAIIDWFGPIVNEYYGGTETGLVVACTSQEWLAHPGTVGKPLAGCAVSIRSPSGEPLAAGEAGDIYLWNSGWGDFTYHRRDDERRAIERDGLVTVGDVGYLDDDGYLYLCDRRRDMIISGGVNIYPAEIEAALVGHPAIHDCAVFGVPNKEFGEDIAAIIELRAGASTNADELRAYLRERIAGYKVPRLVEFATDLPREDSGKIFKRRLRDRYWPTDRAI